MQIEMQTMRLYLPQKLKLIPRVRSGTELLLKYLYPTAMRYVIGQNAFLRSVKKKN